MGRPGLGVRGDRDRVVDAGGGVVVVSGRSGCGRQVVNTGGGVVIIVVDTGGGVRSWLWSLQVWWWWVAGWVVIMWSCH